MSAPRTLLGKLWDLHRVAELDDDAELLHIDRIALHERAGALVLRSLAKEGRAPLDPASVVCVMDHVVDTRPGRTDATPVPNGEQFIRSFRDDARRLGLRLFDIGDPRQGIAHVSMAEQALALPGLSLICADSHTCTLGALGALAFGVGVSEIKHGLATQTLSLKRPKTMRVTIDGALRPGVSAKDAVLHLIATIGAGAGVGFMVEYAGEAVRALSVEGRMTLCNMAVEFGAWSAAVAPDDTTFAYLESRPFAPQGEAWEAAVRAWRELSTDEGAAFDHEVTLDVSDLRPQVSWGVSPQFSVDLDTPVPRPGDLDDPQRRGAAEAALRYMELEPGVRLRDVAVDAVFIGSCTNARIEDLRSAAAVLAGRRVAANVAKAIVVPGSTQVRLQGEAEGLDRVFRDAGFEWRESGCSLCFFAGGESFPPGARVASTTNRNFENRQGPGIKTHIMSPASAAATAVAGRFADPGDLAS